MSRLEGQQDVIHAETGEGSGSIVTFRRAAAWEDTRLVFLVLHLWDQIRAQLTSPNQGRISEILRKKTDGTKNPSQQTADGLKKKSESVVCSVVSSSL